MIPALQALLKSGLPVHHTALGAFHTKPEKATALLLPVNTLQLLHVAIDQQQAEAAAAYKFNSEKTVAVSNDTFFNEDMKDCPRSVKLQLLGAGGVASYGEYNGDSFWIGWCPVPRRHPRPERPKETLEEIGAALEAEGYDLDELEKDSPYYTNPYA